MRELPALQAVTQKLAPDGVAFVTVVLNGTPADSAAAVARTGLTAPVVVGDAALQQELGVTGYPSTLIAGRDGKVRALMTGAHEAAAFETAFRKHL